MKIKIGKTTWIFIGGAMFLIVMGVLGMNYRTQAEARAQIKSQIALTRQNIAIIPIVELTAKQTALKSELAATNAKIEDVKTSLHQTTKATQIIKTLYEIAESNNLDLYNEESSGLTTQNMAKIPFASLPLKLDIRGSVPDIIKFVNDVTTKFSTSVVKPVQIEVPVGTAEPIISQTWSIDSGSLPEGLKLDPSTGAITGIPDATGTSSFTVTAKFSDNTSVNQHLSITIDPHKITTGSLSNGELNIPYSQTLESTSEIPSTAEIKSDETIPSAAITMNILSYEGK